MKKCDLDTGDAVQQLLHPTVVDVVGPVYEVLVDVDLGEAAICEVLPGLGSAGRPALT